LYLLVYVYAQVSELYLLVYVYAGKMTLL
jgi:hypothetical protein